MEDLMEGGKVKNIGVSNFNIEQLKEILSIARVKPFCNQFEVHPLLPNYELVEFCQSQGLITVAYAPLGVRINKQICKFLCINVLEFKIFVFFCRRQIDHGKQTNAFF